MKRHFTYMAPILGAMMLVISSCQDDIDPVVEELDTSRAFTPVNLEARIRNQTTIEVDWTANESIEEYIVEFYEDSLEFNAIIRSVTVAPEALPVTEAFFGDTRYSIRVKAISKESSQEESAYAETTIRTEAENIFLPFLPYDLLWDEMTVRFPENSEVSSLIVNPGNIERTISADEASSGIVKISGLLASTEYTVSLFSNTSKRGEIVETTLVDPDGPNVTLLNPGDDIANAVATLVPGNIIVLDAGDYVSASGTITVDKELTIRGLYPYDKPVIYNAFELQVGAVNTQFIDLEMDGQENLATVITLNEPGDLGSVMISGCTIHDYGRQLISGSVAAELDLFSVDNSIVSNFIAGGGDFIDFRGGHVGEVILTNSTFFNAPSTRDFIRLDDSSGSFPSRTSTVEIDHCTFFAIADNSRRLLYVRFLANDISVRNSIIAETSAFYTRENNAEPLSLSNNNYFNAEGFHTADYRSEAGFQFDDGSSFTTLDPGFANAANGDLTVSNQTLKDNAVGDPRWLK